MSQIWKMRTPDGNTVTPGDWTGAEPLFSTIGIAEGNIGRLSAFSYGKGSSSVPGSIGPRQATDADTNLEGEGGRLPENEELIVYNIAIEVFAVGTGGNDAADVVPQSDPPEVSLLNMLRLQRDLMVAFRIASVDKIYIKAPLSYFPASMGVHQWNSGARSVLSGGTDGYVSASNGSVNADDIRILASPLRVRGGETFGVDFEACDGAITGLNVDNTVGPVAGRLRLRTYLDGYRRRPMA